VDRGGDITYHGPGQLVGYPIMYLGKPEADGRLPQVDYVGYLRQIEAILMRALSRWRIAARRVPGFTGVWVEDDELLKIAAIGVRVDGRGVSQHGFALNVEPELGFFDGIVPCGIQGCAVTSMRRLLGRPVPLEAVRQSVADAFGKTFHLRWERIEFGAFEALLGADRTES
jgi:lipoate-protein ligase B